MQFQLYSNKSVGNFLQSTIKIVFFPQCELFGGVKRVKKTCVFLGTDGSSATQFVQGKLSFPFPKLHGTYQRMFQVNLLVLFQGMSQLLYCKNSSLDALIGDERLLFCKALIHMFVLLVLVSFETISFVRYQQGRFQFVVQYRILPSEKFCCIFVFDWVKKIL